MAPGLERVTAVVVHFGDPAPTCEAVRRLSERLRIVVVDNGPQPGAIEERLGRESRPIVVGTGKNLGFARGANNGAAATSDEYLLFLNADSKATDADLDRLFEVLDSSPHLAAVGPALVDAKGRVQLAGGGRQPTLRTAFWHAATGGRVGRQGLQIRPRRPQLYPVEWVAGTCLLIRRAAFMNAGGFDETYPLYCEDMALGQRLTASGWQLAVDGRVRVPHAGGGSAPDARWLWSARGGALGYFIKRNQPKKSLVIRWMLAVGYVSRAGVLALTPGGRGRSREMWTYAIGVIRAQPPVLPQC